MLPQQSPYISSLCFSSGPGEKKGRKSQSLWRCEGRGGIERERERERDRETERQRERRGQRRGRLEVSGLPHRTPLRIEVCLVDLHRANAGVRVVTSILWVPVLGRRMAMTAACRRGHRSEPSLNRPRMPPHSGGESWDGARAGKRGCFRHRGGGHDGSIVWGA